MVNLDIKNNTNIIKKINLKRSQILALSFLATFIFAIPFNGYSQEALPDNNPGPIMQATEDAPSLTDEEQFQMYKNIFYNSFIDISNIVGLEIVSKEWPEFQALGKEKVDKICSYITPFFQTLLFAKRAALFSLGQEVIDNMDQRTAESVGFSADTPLYDLSSEFQFISVKYLFCMALQSTSESDQEGNPTVSNPIQTEEIIDLVKSYFPFLKWIETTVLDDAPPFENHLMRRISFPFLKWIETTVLDDAPPFENHLMRRISFHVKESYNLDYDLDLTWNNAVAQIDSEDKYRALFLQVYKAHVDVLRALSKAKPTPGNKELCGYVMPYVNSYNNLIKAFKINFSDRVGNDIKIVEAQHNNLDLREEARETMQKLATGCTKLDIISMDPDIEINQDLKKDLNTLFKTLYLFERMMFLPSSYLNQESDGFRRVESEGESEGEEAQDLVSQ